MSNLSIIDQNKLDSRAEEMDARRGEVMLNGVYAFLGRFVAYPSDHARVAHALWCVHAHLMDRWEDVLMLIDEALATQAAAHAVEMTARDVALAELKTVIQALSVAGASPNKPNFVPLKRATFGPNDYQNVLNWCGKGLIVARKDVGRWFVDTTSLEEYRAIRGR
jgi:hypothetical protein